LKYGFCFHIFKLIINLFINQTEWIMKKYLSLFVVLCFSISISAQTINKDNFKSGFKAPVVNFEEPDNFPGIDPTVTKKIARKPYHRDLAFINPIPIGQAGNAWGFSFQRSTWLWADNDINSITFIHRMENPPGTGFLAYDVSMDGGMSWSVNNQVYDPTLPDAYNARYPQGFLFNPEGNTDPEEAYFGYFAPTLDNSNPSGDLNWGGYAYGVKKLAEGSLPTQHNQTSSPDFRQQIPSALTLTQLGEAWVVDEESVDESGSYVFNNSLIVGHGIWDDQLNDFEYEFDEIEMVIQDEEGVNDTKIAFAPDGMTGYICCMSTLEQPLQHTTYHPILFKTTDGGETWSDDPIEVQLGGQNGIEGVKNFISNEMLAFHFDPEPPPPRDEIDYFMGFHIDLAVDAWGNPHIVGVCAIADQDEGVWWHYEGVFSMFHIWSPDQGTTWQGFELDSLVTFDAEWTGSSGSTLPMYNRPQVSTTPDGAIVFFSWLDTRLEGIEDNSQPDIYFREYLPSLGEHGEEVVNVTNLSAAMWSAYGGCMSHYVFTEVNDASYECTIPFVYEEFTSQDISLPVQFWYIPDFERSYTLVDIMEPETGPIVTFAQNQPNPFRGTTYLNLNLVNSCNVNIEVYNLAGQKVKEMAFGRLQNGPHRLTLNMEELTNGIYFYTVLAGHSKYTGKMIAQ
jgi:hypothetical protein